MRDITARLLFILFALGSAACSYPAPAPSWVQADRDEPARAPDVPYEPSSDAAITAMLDLARPGPNDVVYDLGCGDGRVVIAAIQKTGARGVCVDIDPQRIREAYANAQRAGVDSRLSFRTEDLFTTDIRDASVVLLFLWPEINLKLLPKLRRDLRPGTRIVSNMHDMGSFAPDRTVTLETGSKRPHRVYLWRIP